jgi:D-tyrosyl-tRNA(Tyr) deacylase
VLLGIAAGDDDATCSRLARKVPAAEIGDVERVARSTLQQVREALAGYRQPTLAAGTGSGNQPSFTEAARPEQAEPLYEQFCAELRALGTVVATGVFGAKMEVELVNDGPVTIVLDG